MIAPSNIVRADYVSILHNLKQKRRLDYDENITSEGPPHQLVWNCWIQLKSVSPPLRELDPQPFWGEAATRGGARAVVARNILYTIGYFKPGSDDVEAVQPNGGA
ncbi:hypothetical protein FRC04_002914 [Tulasnella sp. 424]|nr:hypothetical protein FRC04_002914 [Tulasnella sp. 424]KAG8966952.1 hypothetical protein FRC05_002328 [Tulasnella sp. 425]